MENDGRGRFVIEAIIALVLIWLFFRYFGKSTFGPGATSSSAGAAGGCGGCGGCGGDATGCGGTKITQLFTAAPQPGTWDLPVSPSPGTVQPPTTPSRPAWQISFEGGGTAGSTGGVTLPDFS